jgi:hypothetical protein
MKRCIQLLFVAGLLLSCTGRSSVLAAASLPGLSVSGTQIVANGVPVRLRGVNMGDPFWARNSDWYPILTISNYATLGAQWHANIVRISVFPTQWKHMDHAQLLAGLAREVNAALSNGMYVIISYHVIGWPDGYYQPAYPGNPADTYDSAMSVATSFWNQISQTYGSDTRILFDLWNEPANPVDLTSDPSDPNPLWPILKPYYATLIQTVRNNHAQNIVIATGNRWASWLVGIKDSPLSDPNVVYAYHKYSVPGQNAASVWNTDTGGLIGVMPVIVSEWGYEDVDAGANPQWPGTAVGFGVPFTAWLEANNLSSLVWMYHYDWTPALLKSDGSLTLYGNFAKTYIASHNAPSVTRAFSSLGAQDGWVLESGENTGVGGTLDSAAATLLLGDNAANKQYRAVVCFNTASLPDNAVITSAALKLRKAGQPPANPFSTLGGITVDIKKGPFNTAPLQITDFQAAASRNAILTFTNNLVNGWYSKALPAVNFAYINKAGITQFRLRFAKDDNNNSIADFISLYSGNYAVAASRPTLTITYQLP